MLDTLNPQQQQYIAKVNPATSMGDLVVALRRAPTPEGKCPLSFGVNAVRGADGVVKFIITLSPEEIVNIEAHADKFLSDMNCAFKRRYEQTHGCNLYWVSANMDFEHAESFTPFTRDALIAAAKRTLKEIKIIWS